MQALLAAVCALGVLIGARIAHLHSGLPAPPLTAQALAGTWELESVNGDPVGPNADSVLLAQRITFQGGKLQGETHLRADTAAATTSMPFPDASVRSVQASADGHEVTVSWDGAYTLRQGRTLQFQVGKASYQATITLNPAAHTLTLDHDAILTFPGPTRYHLVSTPATQPKATFTLLGL
jgi:hypothetical protein